MLIHLRSAAYVRAHRADFPHAYTIQAKPRLQYGEGLDGGIWRLAPTADEWALGCLIVAQRREGGPAAIVPEMLAAYRASMERRWRSDLEDGWLSPSAGTLRRLVWEQAMPPKPDGSYGGRLLGPVPDGSALCCSCSAAEAAAGRCHRAWAAPFLARAGWSVVLDGVALP